MLTPLQIKNSVFDSPISLTEFNNQTAAKYKLGGLGDKPLDQTFTVRNAILVSVHASMSVPQMWIT